MSDVDQDGRVITRGTLENYKITIIAPTCFYYQVPLFRNLSADDRIDLTVYFCSDEGLSGSDVKSAYGSNETWGVENELLKGYQSKFLRNYAPKGSYLKSLIGLANLGIWEELRRERPDALIIMSWMNPTWWLAFLASLRFKIPILFMTDANFTAEGINSHFKSWVKHHGLEKVIFPNVAGFLCSGTQNRRLYSSYGVPDDKLVTFAYSWGYDPLIEESESLKGKKAELRREIGLPEEAVIALYCGRLSPEKGIKELLIAYNSLPHPNKALVMVGDGVLRTDVSNFAKEHEISHIYQMGFQKRADIGKFYAAADFLVLPSHHETWGIVVNEALCFSLPVIISDQVGSGADLVFPGENGHVFKSGSSKELAEKMSDLIDLPEEDRLKMGEASMNVIETWLDRSLADSIVEYLETIQAAG